MTIINRIQLESGVVHVESNGDPLGRLILCVHGLSANCRSFDHLVPPLVAAGHHVVTMDLRGRGHSEISPPGAYGWDSHVQDLLQIAQFYGADAFDLIGHSMGGFIGMTLAAGHRRLCRRLVLIDAVGVPEAAALVAIGQSVSRLGQSYPSAAAALAQVRSAGTISPWNEFWDNYIEWELEPDGESAVRIRTDVAAVMEDSAHAAGRDVYDLWRRIRCPVLLIRANTPIGSDGGLVVSAEDAERFAEELPNATVVEVDSDHYTVLLDQVAVDAVVHFLQT